MRLRAIADALSAQVIGDDSLEIRSIVHPADATGRGDLALALAADALAALDQTQAEAVVVAAASAIPQNRYRAVLVADPGRATLAVLTALFDPGPRRSPGVHPTADIGRDVLIDSSASIGPYVVIGAGSRIGPETVVMSHVTIGTDVLIGANGLIHAGVRIGDRVVIGDRVIVQPNAVVGADGFSFIPVRTPDGSLADHDRPLRIHSLGRVMIGDDVEIGANTTIDRATLRATRIGSGTKIDNLVQIGHNVTIGECCLIAGMTGIAGSTTLGDRVMVGGGAGIADHVRVGSNATIAAGSGVASAVPEGAVVSGYPALRHDRSVENFLYLGRQKALHRTVGGLQSRLEALENAAKATKQG